MPPVNKVYLKFIEAGIRNAKAIRENGHVFPDHFIFLGIKRIRYARLAPVKPDLYPLSSTCTR